MWWYFCLMWWIRTTVVVFLLDLVTATVVRIHQIEQKHPPQQCVSHSSACRFASIINERLEKVRTVGKNPKQNNPMTRSGEGKKHYLPRHMKDNYWRLFRETRESPQSHFFGYLSLAGRVLILIFYFLQHSLQLCQKDNRCVETVSWICWKPESTNQNYRQ